MTKYGIWPASPHPFNPFNPGEPIGYLPKPSAESFNISDTISAAMHRREDTDLNDKPKRPLPKWVFPFPEPTEPKDRQRPRWVPFPYPDEPDDDGPRTPGAIAVQDLLEDPGINLQLSDFIFHTIDTEEPRSIPDDCPYNPEKCERESSDCEKVEESLRRVGLDLEICPSRLAQLHLMGAI